jgi:uncharacterized protein with NAD-binding domain and iron-sulfur cluster
VAVLGGGVGGLTAAHELAERGFEVFVYERRGPVGLGGKARSMDVPQSARAGRRALPGEHGMRTFPGFYLNLPDTLRRIPYAGGGNVFGNLAACSQLDFARAGGRADVVLPLTLSAGWTPAQIRQAVEGLLQTGLGIPPQEAAWFADRLLVFMSSCDARRFGEWERISWERFTASDRYSTDYGRLLAGWINRQLLAARAADVSALTVAILWEAGVYNMMGRSGTGSFDRVLSLPTNEAWIDPWVTHLRRLGVRFCTAEVLSLQGGRGGLTRVVARGPDGVRRRIVADWYVLAVPAERAAPLLRPLAPGDPPLGGVAKLTVRPEAGIQFYLRRRTPVTHGHVLYVDSPWALSSISQAQFWPARSFSRDYGDGSVRDCLSVDVADWATPGILFGKPARACTPSQLARETWAQMKAALNDTGDDVLDDSLLHSWFLDPGVRRRRGELLSADPLLISTPGSWGSRPAATTQIANLFLAADYVQTQINTSCMEGANEAARRAVGALLAAAGSREPPPAVHSPYRPPEFESLKALDARRYAAGQSNVFDGPAPPATAPAATAP